MDDVSSFGEDESLFNVVTLKENLYKALLEEDTSTYRDTLMTKLKEEIIRELVNYGTYLKTQYEQSDEAAEQALKTALKYDRTIPQAHYRLGFIAYKRKIFHLSILHFQNAVRHQKRNPLQIFGLSKQQQYNANIYLSNSALYIAVAAQEESEMLLMDIEVREKRFDRLELSPLYELIEENDIYLANRMYTLITSSGTGYCSRSEYERLNEQYPDHLVLDFTDRNYRIGYKGVYESISYRLADVLLILMRDTTNTFPATKDTVQDILHSHVGELDTNTYSQTIRRIRAKLAQVSIQSDVIASIARTEIRDTSYYYDSTVTPFIVVQRSDFIR